MSAEIEVHKASDQFYAAMNRLLNGDADSMESIWSRNSSVTILQPIGGRTVGWLGQCSRIISGCGPDR
jgi:hypothetical protein